MTGAHSLDLLVRSRLRNWPQRPPGIACQGSGRDKWLRGRPATGAEYSDPFLKLPGSDQMRTLPDGLWLKFGGTPVEPFVDILAVEACGSLPNLLDKRSRFATSTQSMLAVCPVPWLLGDISATQPTARWEMTELFLHSPAQPLVLPVRDMRVLYGLKSHHYRGFARSQIPHPHEYFVPMDLLTAENGYRDPALCALLSRATAASNFLDAPGYAD